VLLARETRSVYRASSTSWRNCIALLLFLFFSVFILSSYHHDELQQQQNLDTCKLVMLPQLVSYGVRDACVGVYILCHYTCGGVCI
jgi:hypothetical protein